jgi:putative flippase GtrA
MMSGQSILMPNTTKRPKEILSPDSRPDNPETSNAMHNRTEKALHTGPGNSFVMYLVIAGMAAVVNLVSRSLLSQLGVNFPVAVSLAYLIGMVFNFAFNRYFNFRSHRRTAVRELRTFTIVSIFGLVLTESLSVSLLFILPPGFLPSLPFSSETIAHVIAVGLVSIYSFAAHRYITFEGGISANARTIKAALVRRLESRSRL